MEFGPLAMTILSICKCGCSGQWGFEELYASDPLWDEKQCSIVKKECCENSSFCGFTQGSAIAHK